MDFPISPDAVKTLVGAAFIAGVITQWLKKYLGDSRWIPVFVLLLGILIQLGAVMLTGGLDWWGAVMRGFLAASITTFGYEVVANLLGVFGIGDRAVK